MPAASVDASAGEALRPLIRIRTLLMTAVVAAGAWWAYPRGQAAWQLHSSAAALADYGLCMVGPTGPSLLRDNPAQFMRLVRRRVVASAANERPFYECAGVAEQLTGSVEVGRAHTAAAWSFVEYGGAAADRAQAGSAGELRVSQLRVTTRRLAELSVAAWPFVRDGYTKLVKPSASAREAVHTTELPAPAIGSGLPAWRARYRAVRRTEDGYWLAVGSAANLSVYETTDRGLHFRPVSARRPGVSEFAERCPAGDARAYSFGLTDDDRHLVVTSLGPDGPPSSTKLASSELEVFAAACDARALVAALRAEGSREVSAKLCRFRGPCSDLRLPSFPEVDAPARYPLDLARVGGVTVVAVAMHDIVRVASSPDDGGSWTPYSVAFDRSEHPELRVHVEVPDHLLALGSRLLLYGGAPEPSQTYFVLVSDNAGASWRTP